MKLNLIGAGKLGTVLAHLIAHTANPHQLTPSLMLQDVKTRSIESAQQAVQLIQAGRAVSELSQMRTAEIWLLAVSDSQIAPVAQELALHLKALDQEPSSETAFKSEPLQSPRRPIVCHFSGALASDQLQALIDIGCHCASVHPILSFAQFDLAVKQFQHAICALEGRALAVDFFKNLFTQWGLQCFEIQAENKLCYHAAAVFATNFLPVLAYTAQQLWQTSGVPTELQQPLLNGLLENAVRNIQQLGPVQALTGPAARKDLDLIHQQQMSLESFNPVMGQAYAALSQLALAMAELRNKTA